MSASNRTPVTVLGLGPMGRALARALLSAGYPTTVWNRTPGKAAALVEAGAAEAPTAAAAAQASPIVLVCVIDAAAVASIVRPLGDDLRRRTLVTSPPRRRPAHAQPPPGRPSTASPSRAARS